MEKMKTLVKISLVSAFILSLGVESLVAHAADTPYVSNGILDMIPGTGEHLLYIRLIQMRITLWNLLSQPLQIQGLQGH